MLSIKPKHTMKQQLTGEVLKQIRKGNASQSGDGRHDVVLVDPGNLNSCCNSVNILVGQQGKGKTLAALVEALGIRRSSRRTRMLIFVKKKVYDPTFEHVKSLMEAEGCAVKETSYEDAEENVQALLLWKSLYNALKRSIDTESEPDVPAVFEPVTQDTVTQMFAVLNIKNFDADWLNTIVIFEDASSSGLFKKPDLFFNNRLRLCRDDNVIYFITIHGINLLSPSLRQNVAVTYVFRGLSAERLQHVYSQSNSPDDWRKFKSDYQNLGEGERAIVIDNLTATQHVE
jgi:hypothetical protein